jgi:hypothetical protein
MGRQAAEISAMSLRRIASACALALALMIVRNAYAGLTIAVQGDRDCPSADMVRVALKRISPDAEWWSKTVIVDASADRLALTLDDDRGARREIPATADCQARAETVALVIRAWSGELPSHPTSAPILTVTPPAASPAPADLSSHVFELDGAVFYSPVWGHAPGIGLGLDRTPRRGGLGFRVFGAYQAAQDLALAGGKNHFARLLVGAAPTLHAQGDTVFASADVGLVVTFTRAMGDGYEIREDTHTWNLGAVGDIRGGVHLGRWRFWMDARLLRLFHQETITIASHDLENADSRTLETWDLLLGIGMGARFE